MYVREEVNRIRLQFARTKPKVNSVAYIISMVAAGVAISALNLATPVMASDISEAQFKRWISDFRAEARLSGVSKATLDRAFKNLKKPSVAVRNSRKNQPEIVRTSGDYVAGLVSKKRIRKGRVKLDKHRALLTAIESSYGVDPHVLVALWGVETHFGSNTGRHSVIKSLTTLAMTHKRRKKYWRAELLAALHILDEQHISLDRFKGSWAGAMGHIQFMPTSYRRHGVDFDGDGRKDIWQSKADALASAAEFLRHFGWQLNRPWGVEVRLPKNFDFALAEPSIKKERSWWTSRGVSLVKGIGWLDNLGSMHLILPAGAEGPAFLVTSNFKALMRYNPSVSYALAVGHLSDRIAGAPEIVQDWPSRDSALRRMERKELQRLLNAHGHKTGLVDGIIGKSTKQAIRAFQKVNGLPADGHPSRRLLATLRARVR